MNKKGFSLTEILVGVGILGILGSIATVSYRGYILDIEKRTLKDSGKLFQVAVDTCIKGMGGWELSRVSGTPIYPCKATTTKDTPTTELKDKLNYTCPTKATCEAKANTKDDKPYYCLSIKKELSGKKLQVLVRIHYNDPADYQLWCGEVSTPLPLGDRSCRGGDIPTGQRDSNNKRILESLNDKGFKKGADCWK